MFLKIDLYFFRSYSGHLFQAFWCTPFFVKKPKSFLGRFWFLTKNSRSLQKAFLDCPGYELLQNNQLQPKQFDHFLDCFPIKAIHQFATFVKNTPMKKVLFVLMFTQFVAAQQKFEQDSVIRFQKNMNEHYADSTKSPLKKKDLAVFKALEFFPISEKYFVQAKFIRTKKEKPFEMKTTTSRKPLYVKYGELHFEIEGIPCRLNVYQNVEFSKKPDYKNSLFLPFTDYTSGVESYGGGRYIDLQIQEGENWSIDFNQAYNPYCAYNEKYSCPIVPEENDLKVEIKAGVKSFKK